jgi:hypothetical protein
MYLDLKSTVKAAKKFFKDRDAKRPKIKVRSKKRVYFTSPIDKDTYKPIEKKVNTGEFIPGHAKPRTKLTPRERVLADRFWSKHRQELEHQEWERQQKKKKK